MKSQAFIAGPMGLREVSFLEKLTEQFLRHIIKYYLLLLFGTKEQEKSSLVIIPLNES